MTYPIPAAALHESVAIIGRTGSGKTTAAKGAAEIMLREGQRVCIIDPTGVWYGLRSSADGKSPGFPVVVFGGDHADAVIGDTSGAPLAKIIAGGNIPAIIDVSEFTMGGRVRFMSAFLDELYRSNRQPLNLIMDEADLFAPQRAMPDQTVMLSRMEQICRRGRVRGFRVWLISQRPAEIHKSVLSQANTLVAMQLTAPQDRNALGAWIEGQADKVEGKRVLADLPKLRKGEAWIWSPSHDVLTRAKFPPITTFDSGRSPEDGGTDAPTALAAVDLAAIGDSLRAAEAEAAENDPKALRARIKELEKAKGAWSREDLDAARSEGYDHGRRDTLALALRATNELNRLAREADTACTHLSIALNQPKPSTVPPAENPAKASPAPPERPAPTPAQRAPSHRQIDAGGTTIPAGERSILIAIAQHPNGCTREQLSILAGYKRSTRDAYLVRLQGRQFIAPSGGVFLATESGASALGSDYEPLPTGAALLRHWLAKLPSGEAKILELIVSRRPRPAGREWLSEQSGYQRSSRDAYIQRLAARKLVAPVGRGEVAASGELFE